MLNLEELEKELDKSINSLTPEEAKRFLRDKRSNTLLSVENLLEDIKKGLSESKNHEKYETYLETYKELLDEIKGDDNT